MSADSHCYTTLETPARAAADMLPPRVYISAKTAGPVNTTASLNFTLSEKDTEFAFSSITLINCDATDFAKTDDPYYIVCAFFPLPLLLTHSPSAPVLFLVVPSLFASAVPLLALKR